MLATLKFLADLPLYEEEKPYTLYGFPKDVTPVSNCKFDVREDIPVSDVRESDVALQLDDCGFEIHHRPSSCDLTPHIFESIQSRESVWKYLKETIALAEDILGASRALCFDWRLRRTGSTCDIKEQLDDLQNARFRAIAPATLMHCDYSYQGGLETLQIHLSEMEYQDITEGRARAKIVNVWRPLHTVQHAPLILCDRRSVRTDDIVEVDQVSPTKVEMSMSLKYNENQKYFWLSKQSAEEVILFTSWDSLQQQSFSNHTPHGACLKQPPNPGMKPRESVEVRLIVMWQQAV